MNIQTKIGLRIKELRTEKKITQEGLAFKSNLDRAFFNHVENGRKNVSIDTLQKIITDGLEMNVKDFFDTELFKTGKYFEC